MRLLAASIRSNIRILLLINGVIALLIFSQIWDITTQLNNRALRNLAVSSDEIKASSEQQGATVRTHQTDSTHSSQDPAQAHDAELIPRIIHQTYKTNDIPEKWRDVQESIQETNPSYQYMMWTDETARNFLASNYPWFLKTFDSYKYPIMRADAIRYFLLYHYGGFYIDLDIGLRKSLDDLRALPSVFYMTDPTGVSNDFMAATRGHPFMGYVISSIARYKTNCFLPYLTVMYSTGSLFVSIMLQRYQMFRGSHLAPNTRTMVLHSKADPRLELLGNYIYHVDGSSWHKGDSFIFTFINNHVLLSVVGASLFIIVSITMLLWLELILVRLLQKLYKHNSQRYVPQRSNPERLKMA